MQDSADASCRILYCTLNLVIMKTELEVLDDISKTLDGYQKDVNELTAEVKELKKQSGRILPPTHRLPVGLRKSIMGGIETIISENKTAIGNGEMKNAIAFKAVGAISSANITGDSYQSYLDWRPGMEPTGQLRFRDLVPTIISAGDLIQYPRASRPIGEGSFGRVAEGNTKPQVDRDYEMISLTLNPMAAFAIVSRQSLRNIPFLQSWLPASLMEQLEDSEDTDFANSLVGAATGSTTTTRTVVPEKLISYMKTLIKNKHNPTAIAVDPDIWEDLIVFRPGTDNPYSLPGVVTVTNDGNIRLLGRPVYPVNWLTNRRVLVGDFKKAAIVQSEGLTLRQSDSHASIFTANQIAFLLERTEGLAIFRPDAFITAVV